jgi:acyl transferase domain-containing protein
MTSDACKTFDASANGYGRGEGFGAVVLTRLSDAEKEKQSILAVLRGTAVNQDGRSSSLTAPNGPSQQEVIRTALRDGQVAPRDVQYLECHGTGTALGDPIEVGALKAVFGAERDAAQPLVLGAVKTNVGHTEAAAGMAGFCKIVMALQHRAVPPNLHLQKLNPLLDIADFPVVFPDARIALQGTKALVRAYRLSASAARTPTSSSKKRLGRMAPSLVEAAPVRWLSCSPGKGRNTPAWAKSSTSWTPRSARRWTGARRSAASFCLRRSWR